ncbi:MAG: Bacterial pre-peptidase C-terminal domain [Chthonomonadaceae bacterium]|nr:Bacterial pre-peptidase C-terminal domain [Chthonomonadaceae bacterium]
MGVRNPFRLCLTLLTCLGCLSGLRPAGAQTSFPMIIATYPTGVQRGKTTDITVTAGTVNGGGGANLYGAYKALFEGPGIKAEVIPPEKGWPAKDPKTPFAIPTVASVTLRVTVASDAPLGVREFRVATAHNGVSSLGQLVVGDEPEINEVEPNNDAEHAQAVTIPSVLNGRIGQGEDIDCFKFKVIAGQEVTFAVLCARLEDKIHDLSPHADPMLTLRDSTGHELARNDDYYRADPLLHYRFEKAGEYQIQLRDVGYAGQAAWVYRLNMTSRPFVTSVVPCAVRPGQANELHISGFNLGGATTVKLNVPAGTPSGLWTASLDLPTGTSNVVPLTVIDAPQAAFVPASAPAPATSTTVTTALTAPAAASAPVVKGTLALPGGVNSWVAEGQIDRYRFHTDKPGLWAIEVTARRLDSEMDSEIKIKDSNGKVVAENDDAIGKDSRVEWTAPAAGDYTIEVRDLAGHGGPTYFYNLSALPLQPDFKLKCDVDRAMIAPGNRTAWFIIAERKHGAASEIKVEVKGLPPGVTATPLTIPPMMTQGPIIFTAAADAKIDYSNVEIVGTAMLPGADGKQVAVTHTAHPMTEIYMPGGGRGQMEVLTQGIAVTEPNDIEVSTAAQQITIAPGGTAKIEVTIKRRPDYTKPVTLDLRVNHLGGIFTNPLPPGITCDDGVTIAEGQTKGTITLKAAADAKPIENYPLAVMANVSVNFVMKVWYVAAPVSLTVSAPPPPAKK